MKDVVIHRSKGGTLLWIDESHSMTNSRYAMCRVLDERGRLQHYSLHSRADLIGHLITDMHNGVVDLGGKRLNVEDDINKPKA